MGQSMLPRTEEKVGSAALPHPSTLSHERGSLLCCCLQERMEEAMHTQSGGPQFVNQGMSLGQSGFQQNHNPMTQGGMSQMMQGHPQMMQGHPQMMQGGNPQVIQGGTPQMMQGGNPQMMQGGNPQMMQGGNPQMMQSMNPQMMPTSGVMGGGQSSWQPPQPPASQVRQASPL